MPSPLEVAGAAIQPTSAAPLHVNEFFTGLWTNGNPLGPGPVPYLYQRFYSANRFDRLIDGNDTEISPRLTLIRRPGHSVYNSVLFPPINRFFEFRGFTQNDEVIHLLADCDGSLNQLNNPDFVSGATGWDFQAATGGTGGWVLGYGGLPVGGLGNAAQFGGTGTAAVVNTKHISCTAGTVISASCWGLGELGVTGTAVLRINFYNASNALLTTVTSSPVPNTYIWTFLALSGTAPAATAYATVDFSVTGAASTGPRWFAYGFKGGYAPLAPTVREVTQPSTNTILWQKNPAAGRTSFVSVGNVLYAGDGIDTHQWVTSAKSWINNAQYQPGDFITDPNNNLQMAVGAVTATIVNIQVDDVLLAGGTHGRKVTLWFSSATPMDVPNNIRVTTAGLTTVPAANETTPYTVIVNSVLELSWVEATTAIPVTPFSAETGTASTGAGISGGAAPAWNTSFGLVTQDNTLQWVNMGSAVQPWGGDGPTTAPTISQAPAPTVYPGWAANTFYAPQGAFAIVDSNGNMQQVNPPGGQTAASGPPVWATALGAVTTDGTVKWTNQGPATWQASHNYAVGAAIQDTYGYTVITYQWTSDGHGGFMQVPVPVQATATSLFQVIVAGMSGLNKPSWNAGPGVVTKEPSGLTWRNMGTTTAYPGASKNIATAPTILDPNGYLQKPTAQGQTGAAIPATWGTALGALTTDNLEIWVNAGAYATAITAPWQWAYSGKNSITGDISPASPISIPFVPTVNNAAIIQGAGMANPPWDTIVLWRTKAGGSTLLYEDEFPNPGAGQTWIYTDTNPDSALDVTTTAPINSQNNPPPAGFVPEAYYLGRIWGYVNNQLRWSGGPDITTGNGNSAFAPGNQFRFPAKGVLCWPTSIGLICYTTCDIWAVLGKGTLDSAFYVVNFQAGIGMASQDAFGVNGSTAYAMLTSHQVVSMDPGAGELEVGFPIADGFDTYVDPKLAYVTWHQGRSADTALYVSNGSNFWFRMAAVSAPESGNVWSPAAVMHAPGGVRAMISAEITPGDKVLVLGPDVDGNPILKRDPSTHSDNGVAFIAHATIAPIVIAQPGTTAGVQFVVTEEKQITGASAMTVKLLFDEIHDYVHVHEGDFRTLRNITADPPNLAVQKSLRTQRLWGLQDPSTVIKCRFFEQDISWPAEDFANELLTNTVYGRLPEKARK